MRKVIYFGLLSVMITLISAPLFAAFNIIRSLSVKEVYDDNIFLDSSNEEDDFITIISPNVAFEYSPNKSMDLNLDFGLNFKFYSDNSELNRTSIIDGQSINLQYQVRNFKHIFVDISDTFKRVQVDVNSKFADDNDLNTTLENVFSFSPYMILPLRDTITATLGYEYVNTWHEDDAATDSQSHEAFLTLRKRFSSKINGALKYNYFAYRPDLADGSHETIKKYDSHDGSIAADYQITRNLSVNGEFGKTWFFYDSKTLDDSDSFFWSIGTNYTFVFLGSTSLGANYSSSFSDSSTSGLFKSRRVDFSIETGRTIKLNANSYYTIDEYADADREDEITGVAVDISRIIFKRLHVSLNGLWEKQEFFEDNKDRIIHRYSAGSSINYNLGRYITTGVGYRYKVRNSDIVNDDYKNNIAWLQASLTF